MALIEHYVGIKSTHVALVAASGTLFALRGAGVLAGQRWPLQAGWRTLSVLIDVGLLAAGVSLWMALRLTPATSPWLVVKLALLVVYVVLGTFALKRAKTPQARFGWYAAALATFLFMVTVALRHHPLGIFFLPDR